MPSFSATKIREIIDSLPVNVKGKKPEMYAKYFIMENFSFTNNPTKMIEARELVFKFNLHNWEWDIEL